MARSSVALAGDPRPVPAVSHRPGRKLALLSLAGVSKWPQGSPACLAWPQESCAQSKEIKSGVQGPVRDSNGVLVASSVHVGSWDDLLGLTTTSEHEDTRLDLPASPGFPLTASSRCHSHSLTLTGLGAQSGDFP